MRFEGRVRSAARMHLSANATEVSAVETEAGSVVRVLCLGLHPICAEMAQP